MHRRTFLAASAATISAATLKVPGVAAYVETKGNNVQSSDGLPLGPYPAHDILIPTLKASTKGSKGVSVRVRWSALRPAFVGQRALPISVPDAILSSAIPPTIGRCVCLKTTIT